MARPLENVKVLDLSRVLAAPLAGQWLADMGADVVKVERPGKGDESRSYGPPFFGEDGQRKGLSGFYLSANRNKRSITVDLAKAEGQRLVAQMAAQSDVVIENYRVGTLRRYGLDYPTLSAANPRLVYCSITGYGQTGPSSHRPGYDGVFQAISGLMSVSGHPDGEPGAGPMKVGISIVDVVTSYYAGMAVLAALYHRDTVSGRGQHIDLALLDASVACLTHYATNYLVCGETQGRRGNAGYGGVPSQTFPCADGEIFLTAGNDEQFRRTCAVLERPDLLKDPRLATAHARVVNRLYVSETLGGLFRRQPAAYWLDRLDAADVPSGRINDVAAAFEDPQVRHNRMAVEVDGEAGLRLVRNPIRFSDTPLDRYAAPPLVGEHTDAVLLEMLGLDAEACAGLRAQGVI